MQFLRASNGQFKRVDFIRVQDRGDAFANQGAGLWVDSDVDVSGTCLIATTMWIAMDKLLSRG